MYPHTRSWPNVSLRGDVCFHPPLPLSSTMCPSFLSCHILSRLQMFHSALMESGEPQLQDVHCGEVGWECAVCSHRSVQRQRVWNRQLPSLPLSDSLLVLQLPSKSGDSLHGSSAGVYSSISGWVNRVTPWNKSKYPKYPLRIATMDSVICCQTLKKSASIWKLLSCLSFSFLAVEFLKDKGSDFISVAPVMSTTPGLR